MVVIGLDPGFNYQKLAEALDVLQKNNCQIIACNRDRNYPAQGDKILPGCGPIVAAVENACGREADYVVGKPSTFMIKSIARETNLKPREILIIGDSYETDIHMAKRFGSPSVLISDKSRRKEKGVTVVKGLAGVRKLFS